MAAWPPLPSSAQRLSRNTDHATAEGVEFEQRLAGLAALRLRRLGARFQIYSNVADAHPFDDVVLRLHEATYFLQLKHSAARSQLSLGDFRNSRKEEKEKEKEKKKEKKKKKKKLYLDKYFDYFLRLRGWHQMKNSQAALKDGQRLLCEGPMEHCRFVIFTTQQRWTGASTGGALEDEGVHKMARESLNTGAANDCVFRFTQNDSEVWNLLNGEADEDIYQNEFLPNLLIYCEQSPPSEMDILIHDEIKVLCGECGSSQNSFHYTKMLTDQYLGFLKEWMRDNTKDFCLTEDSAEVEWYLAEHLRGEARKACALEVLQFEETHWGPLREALQKDGALLLQVAGVPAGARAAKLLGLLDVEQPGAWLYVGGSALARFHAKALQAVCQAHHCRFLVVDVDQKSKKLDGLLPAVATSVKVVCFGKMNLRSVAVTRHKEEFKFSHLTSDAQNRLLERTLRFQGQAVRLRDLEGTWPRLREEAGGALLGAAALGEAALGDPLPPVGAGEGKEQHLYIPRSLRHWSALNPAVLRLASPQDHLVLVGIPHTTLEGLRRQLGWSAKEMNDRWTALESSSSAKMERAFDTLCSKLSQKNVHWLEYVGGRDTTTINVEDMTLVWRRTHGRADALKKMVRQATPACARVPECVHKATRAPADVAAWGTRASLLVGGPGAGKTSFMARAAAEARRRDPARWTVFVEARAHRKQLLQMPPTSGLALAHVEQLLAAAGAGSSAEATERSLRAALRNGAVAVFVDGVDELCPAFKDKVLRLLELLLRDTRAAPVWVSSRPEVKAPLQGVVGGSCVSLTALTRQEQIRYLTIRFTHLSSLTAQERAERVMDTIANHVPEDTEEGSLLSTPLHLKMVSEIFLDSEVDSMEGGCVLELHDLFRKFVCRKEDAYLEKHGFRDANIECAPFSSPNFFSQAHQNCAMFLLVSDKQYKDVNLQPFQVYIKENVKVLEKMKTGIMWLDDDLTPRFVHYTLVEFFAAQWLSANMTQKAVARTVARSLIAHANRGGGGDLMLHFLDCMLAEELSRHEDAACLREDCASQLAVGSAELRGPGDEPLHIADGNGLPNVLQLLLAEGQWTSSLHLAAANGLAACARALIRHGAAVDGADEAGRTPMHIAAREGHRNVVQILYKSGANINLRTTQGDTALALAAENNHFYCVTFLASRCDLDAAGERGETPLHRAAARGHTIVCQALLEEGAFWDAKSAEGKTPLALAASHGDAYSVAMLLKRGADINVDDARGRTPLHEAAERGHLNAMRVLLDAGADVNAKSTDGKMPLELAACNRHWDCVRDLLDREAVANTSDAEGRSPLHAAAEVGHREAVESLLSAGADVNAKSADGITPLALASGNGHLDCVDILIQKGAAVRAADTGRNTPLHAAAQGGHLHTVSLLLEIGADVNAKSAEEKTPLMLAAENGHWDCVDLLVEKGASLECWSAQDNPLRAGDDMLAQAPEEKTPKLALSGWEVIFNGAPMWETDTRGHTALHAAAGGGHFVLLRNLLGDGGDVNAKSAEGKTPLALAAANGHELCVDLLLQRGADVGAGDAAGYTPLHAAAEGGHRKAVDRLLKAGADVNAKTSEGKTPLAMAAAKGHKCCFDILLKSGAYLHAVDAGGNTPLHAAAEAGHEHILYHFVDLGVDVKAKSSYGKKPLALATGHGRTNLHNRPKVNSEDRTPASTAAEGRHNDHISHQLDVGSDVNAMSSDRKTPIAQVLCNEPFEYVIMDLASAKVMNPEDHAPLNTDIDEGNDDIVCNLMDVGAVLNAVSAEGKTPLALAAGNGHWDCIRILEKKGADICAGGLTPLHTAAEGGHGDVVCHLLDVGADVNAKSADGKLPLGLATANGHWDCVRILLETRADVAAVSLGGNTLLHAAAEGGQLDIIDLLVNAGMDVNAISAERKTPLALAAGNGHKSCVDLLLKKGANVGAVDKGRNTPLHAAAEGGHWGVVKCLVKAGADTSVKSAEGKSPLVLAACRGHLDCVNIILKERADVEATQAREHMPLHAVSEGGQ